MRHVRQVRKKWDGGRLHRFALLAGCIFCLGLAVLAQAQDRETIEAALPPQPGAPAAADDSLTTMFRHAEWEHWWLSGQANLISQWHPSFPSPYQGQNSLTPQEQGATSRVLTLYTGWKPTKTTEFLCDVQETGGDGLGAALGVAGFFNLDVVRNPQLAQAPYIARLMWHQIIPLSQKMVASERNPFSLFQVLPERRFELRFGKFSMADFFDLNTYGTDSNFQFMNWTWTTTAPGTIRRTQEDSPMPLCSSIVTGTGRRDSLRP
jgi:high affinity Mn2+ porin